MIVTSLRKKILVLSWGRGVGIRRLAVFILFHHEHQGCQHHQGINHALVDGVLNTAGHGDKRFLGKGIQTKFFKGHSGKIHHLGAAEFFLAINMANILGSGKGVSLARIQGRHRKGVGLAWSHLQSPPGLFDQVLHPAKQ